jgi:pimeloyl-ACP methyl ester carboxylesterase
VSSHAVSSCRPDDLVALASLFDRIADEMALPAHRLLGGGAVPVLCSFVHECVVFHRTHGELLRATASAFLRADEAFRAYSDRTGAVEASIEAWLPSNRDRERARIANHGKNNLLTFDPRRDGRVVEVLGPVVTADHVAVLIPGMDNDISDYSELRKRAENIRIEMQEAAKPGESVAVIMWLGYDTPDLNVPRLVTEGARSGKAKAGARDLDADIAFLRRVNPAAHLTVVGHSYGTVVVGQALRGGLDVDDAVVLGSPGMDVTDRKDLGSPTVKLWATRHRGRDYIPLLPVHGEDPAAPGFHAERFRSDGVKDHSDYFRVGSPALRNIALIAVGKQPTR